MERQHADPFFEKLNGDLDKQLECARTASDALLIRQLPNLGTEARAHIVFERGGKVHVNVLRTIMYDKSTNEHIKSVALGRLSLRSEPR